MTTAEIYQRLRPLMFSIAYRMLGSVSEAEDLVQEALLRVHRALDAGEHIASPRAFVATVTTRLAINELRSARARREHYVGEWLPEPIITDGRDDPARHAETADSLSVAMLVLLVALSPLLFPGDSGIVGIATDTAVETTLPTAHLDDIEAVAAMMLKSAISLEDVLAKCEAEG